MVAAPEGFADAVKKARKKFIGPSGKAMRLLGDKVSARRLMMKAGVPVVPGTEGEVDAEEAARVAKEIGFPVMVKAAAGGGGKGIRLVHEASELVNALRVSASEA